MTTRSGGSSAATAAASARPRRSTSTTCCSTGARSPRTRSPAAQLAAMFDHVLVDEYQDVNALQVEIVRALRRDNRGLTVVGDDLQAIYGFRAASAEHILDFPTLFPDPRRRRWSRTTARPSRSSTPPTRSRRRPSAATRSGCRARAATGGDRSSSSAATRPRRQRRSPSACSPSTNAGVALREQAVLMRTGHHSDLLELELGRRRIPYVKYGGIRYLEAAHVKDFLALLRLVSNPADQVSWFRVLQLLEGVGPRIAQPDPRRARRSTLATLPEQWATRGRSPAAARERRRPAARARSPPPRPAPSAGRPGRAAPRGARAADPQALPRRRACACATSTSWPTPPHGQRASSSSPPSSRSTRRSRAPTTPARRNSTRTTSSSARSTPRKDSSGTSSI